VRGSGTGPIEHAITIQNENGSGLWLPLQHSSDFNLSVPAAAPLEHFWVEKGAGGPSAEGVHQVLVQDGYNWTGTSSSYAHPATGQPREIIPFTLINRRDGSGLYLGIEFSGRTQITVARSANKLRLSAGLNPQPGPFKTYLAPGNSFQAPPIFVGAFRGNPDSAANILHRWVRTVLNNPATVRDPQYPLLVNNSWGSGMAINDAQARAMIRDSADLGFEMFHLDAGWFRGVGDWQPDPAKFPQGLAPIADYAHAHGLRFGLWMDWAQAGFDDRPGAVNIRDPHFHDWLTTDAPLHWKPIDPFKGVTMDIGEPAVHDWAQSEIDRVVRAYHLDMLEHDGYVVAQGCDRTDHPHAAPDPKHMRQYEDSGFLWVCGTNSTDVSYHATRSYYDIYANLRRQHPELLLEICNDGGRMVDFGSAAHGDYFSISDAYDPLSNRRAFYDSSYVLPPAMLETYVEKWPAPHIENLIYVLRSGMMGWFTLMLDTTAWTPEQHQAAKEAIALYKSKLRPLIREADLFHVSDRPDGLHWDGMEYYNAAERRGALFAFRGRRKDEPHHSFKLSGLDPRRTYRISFNDHSSVDRFESGSNLMSKGLTVHLRLPESSDIVFIQGVD
jgi:alpha-galactosidase